jgi:hypothetical protein
MQGNHYRQAKTQLALLKNKFVCFVNLQNFKHTCTIFNKTLFHSSVFWPSQIKDMHLFLNAKNAIFILQNFKIHTLNNFSSVAQELVSSTSGCSK